MATQLQPPYTIGTATVAAGGTTVTVTGLLDDTNCIEGDTFRNPATGVQTDILYRIDDTHFAIDPWRGAAMAAAAYQIYPRSNLRVSGGRNTAIVNMLIQRLVAKGAVWLLPDSFASPTAAGWGADENQYVYQMGTQQWWRMTAGAWVTSGPPSGVPVLVGNNSFSGQQTITNATDATDATHGGALTVAGGVAIAKKLFVGGAASFGSTMAIADTATFSGVLDINKTTDANITGPNSGSINTTGGIYAAKTVAAGAFSTGVITPQWGSPISSRGAGQNMEWGHSNTSGYGSSLGCDYTSGNPWIAFSGSAGTNNNTYKTNGIRASIIKGDVAGGIVFGTVASANADNQSFVQTGALSGSGALTVASITGSGATLTLTGSISSTSKGHTFGVASGSLYDQPKSQSEANIILYSQATNNWAGIGTDTSGHVWIRTGTSTAVKSALVVRSSSNDLVLPFYGAGTLATNSAGVVAVSSDERLKDIKGNFMRGLAEVRRLRPILYKWNDKSGLADDVVYAGFGAGAVRKVIPEAIGRDDRGYLSLNDRPIIAALVNAVVELDGRLTKIAA